MNKKNLLAPPSAVGCSRAARRYVALALCAVLLTSTAAPSFAQRRTAVRIKSSPGKPATKSNRSNRDVANKANAQDKRLPGSSAKPLAEEVGGVTQVDVQKGGQTTVSKLMKLERTRQLQGIVDEAEETEAERERPNRKGLPQNPNSMPAPQTPPWNMMPAFNAGDGSMIPRAPQTLGTNFLGAQLTATGSPSPTTPTFGSFPPDTMGTVGPTQFIVAVNNRIVTYNKTTGVADGVMNVTTNTFFTSVRNGIGTSDPRIRYDRLSARWFIVIINISTPNRILIAHSDAASAGVITASTVWTFTFLSVSRLGTRAGQTANPCLMDYPTLGVDSKALYIGGNNFCNAFDSTDGYIFSKAALLGGAPTAFRVQLSNVTGPDGVYTPQGVDNYDPLSDQGYFIGTSTFFFGELVAVRVNNPGGTIAVPPTVSALIAIPVAATQSPRNVPHLGNTNLVDNDTDGYPNGNLDALDDRLFAAHIRNGRLWTAHNISVDATGAAIDPFALSPAPQPTARDGVRWYELNGIRSTDNGGTPVVIQSGTIFDPAAANPDFFWIPSVMVSGQGHAAFGMSNASNTKAANAMTTGRLVGDALGAVAVPTPYTTSTAVYNRTDDTGSTFGAAGRRWGDYSYTSLDPKDDMTMWTIQEYTVNTNNSGVQVVKLIAPPPPPTATTTPSNVPDETASTSVAVTGTAPAGEGFYDPGANLAPPALPFNHIAATATGGVTVNSVTYTDPTHVTLDVSTVGASTGPQSVTITNPDGQSVTYPALINVNAVVAPPVPGQILISEFRFQGTAGGNDEFIELYNNTNSAFTVADTNGGTGYAVVATNTTGAFSNRCTVPNGTIIPSHGHFLCTNNAAAGYSLGGYATGDVNYATGIVAGGGVALFSTTTAASWGTGTRYDAVGFSGITGTTLFTEGTALLPAGGISTNGEYSFARRMETGFPQDTDDNNNDFVFVSTTGGTFSGKVSILGAPGPENLASPTLRSLNTQVKTLLLDPTQPSTTPPNRERDTSAGAVGPNSAFGTLTIRRRFLNNTATPITRLRFRVADITTLNTPAVAGQAQLRVLNSGSSVVTVNGVPTTVEGTTVETPPTQASGGGLNSSLGRSLVAGTIINTPIAPGATVNIQFVLGVQVTGNFRFFIIVEALP